MILGGKRSVIKYSPAVYLTDLLIVGITIRHNPSSAALAQYRILRVMEDDHLYPPEPSSIAMESAHAYNLYRFLCHLFMAPLDRYYWRYPIPATPSRLGEKLIP